jgi:hypothetical protein
MFGVIIYRRRHKPEVPQAEATDDTYGTTFTEQFDEHDIDCENPIASYSDELDDVDGDDMDEGFGL